MNLLPTIPVYAKNATLENLVFGFYIKLKERMTLNILNFKYFN